MCEPSRKRFMSSLGSRTSVLSISHPIVSIYTRRHKIENFENFNFFLLLTVNIGGTGILARISCVFRCAYLCLLGVGTCSGPFRSNSKYQKCSRGDALLQTSFLGNSQKTSFWTLLPPVEASKLHFVACRRGFLGASGTPNMHKNGQKGLPRCRKAQSNVQNTLGELRKAFPNFRKIVEFCTFRQDCLGQVYLA